MATKKIDTFNGIAPRIAPSLLSDGMATVAHNCRLKNGKLVPIRQPSFVDPYEHSVYLENGLSRISDANSLYCWKHTSASGKVLTDFLAFPGRTYFAHGNIADDERDRIFVTGETGVDTQTSYGTVIHDSPSVFMFERSTGGYIRHSLIKEPLDVPRCKVSEAPPETETALAYFFFSWFDEYGYESPVSDPSRNLNWGASGYTTEQLAYTRNGLVTFQPVYLPEGAAGLRIYKTNEGEEAKNIQFVHEFGPRELSVLSGEFTLRIDDSTAAETMPEITAPPYRLCDMSFVPGNFYAARDLASPHTVLFSDVDNPSNWPVAYRYDVRDNLVKLAVTANSVFALTDGVPFVLSGTAPESMTVASLATPAACVSERSVVVYRNSVFFASNQGLMAVRDSADSGTVCDNLTERYFTKDQWLALNPSSCRMGAHDNALHMFFSPPEGEDAFPDGDKAKAFVFDLSENVNALTTNDEAALCMVTDDRSDDMYFVRAIEEL